MKPLAQLKKYFALFCAHFPSTLPHQNKDDFNQWLLELFTLFNLPDSPSYRQAVSVAVMHLPESKSVVSKSYFAKVIRKRMASELAYSIIEEVRALDKLKQEEALKLAEKGEPVSIEACESK